MLVLKLSIKSGGEKVLVLVCRLDKKVKGSGKWRVGYL